uniref:Uncharacterized protein LOC113796736 n=1 Tax=Dermatophagoides pteronyssinus TaxID=6956 RepID=A0A6P6YC27_DERPT|nr:uncharacterized protein LOC113796736 [Dermatophagoides pteronyssinus]
MGVNRKNKVHVAPTDEELSRIPRSLVVIIGKRSSNVLKLVSDVRKMLLPWTAKNLNTTTANTLKDFIAVCGVLNITHLFVVKQSQSNVLFRIFKLNAKEKIDKVENSNLDADALKNLCIEGLSTVEIGPRLDITLAQVQSGVFSGTNLWVHPNFDTDKIKVETVDLDDEAISIENDNVNDLIAESGSSSLED